MSKLKEIHGLFLSIIPLICPDKAKEILTSFEEIIKNEDAFYDKFLKVNGFCQEDRAFFNREFLLSAF